MKLNVTRQELDECIANSVAKVLKEYSFDDLGGFGDFSDDDMLDSMLDDPELRDALSTKSAKKAKKTAKAQGEKELASAVKDDEIADEEDTINGVDNSNDEFDDADDDEPANSRTDVNALFQQAAAAETDPYYKKCIDAGVPLGELYQFIKGKVMRRRIEEPDLEYLAKHPMIGRKMDPVDALNMQLFNTSDVDRGGLNFKMKGGVSREGVKKSRQDAEEHGEEFK